MNDLEKAKALIENPHISLKLIAKNTGLKYQTLSAYSKGAISLEKTAWINVHTLAGFYDKVTNSKIDFDY